MAVCLHHSLIVIFSFLLLCYLAGSILLQDPLHFLFSRNQAKKLKNINLLNLFVLYTNPVIFRRKKPFVSKISNQCQIHIFFNKPCFQVAYILTHVILQQNCISNNYTVTQMVLRILALKKKNYLIILSHLLILFNCKSCSFAAKSHVSICMEPEKKALQKKFTF